MNRIVEFDTAIGTSNLGDEIILQSLRREMGFLFDRSFVIRFGTHIENFPWSMFIQDNPKLRFSAQADYKFVMGTNLLSRNLKKTRKQWMVCGKNSWLYENCILAGVGTTMSEGEPTAYSRKIYQRILRKDLIHSVRDEESKRLLEDLGVQAINTGCPTLWALTPEHCASIPKKKADRVVFSLSGYADQRDRSQDQRILDILREQYTQLYYWVQTTRDEEYLESFDETGQIPRISSLAQYSQLLEEGNIDYVGTRLHGGIYALQHGVRSIIIAIDHRARGFNESNHVPVCERMDVEWKLADMINSEWETSIQLNTEAIETWKNQFLQNRETSGNGHFEQLWWVRAGRVSKKIFKKSRSLLMRTVRKIKRTGHEAVYCVRNNAWKEMSVLWKTKDLPVDPHQAMFFTFQGEYTCNPKYISQEVFRRKLPWKQVWVTMDLPENVRGRFPKDVELVQFRSREYYRALNTSGFLIDNAFNFPKGIINKKPGQIYLETMHGSLGLKRIDPDAVRNEKRNRRGRICGDLTDYAFSNSTFETIVYDSSFWPRRKVVETGHARNDIFFSTETVRQSFKEKVCHVFNIDYSVHLALFAPTFRNSDEKSDYEPIDFDMLREALSTRFGGEWIILNRAHRSTKNREKIIREFVLDANDYPDIQELMMAIDVGITDYSSWIFDYVLRRKPGFLYTPDLERYDQARGFYYPIEESPFPVCRTNEILKQAICDFSYDSFERNVADFLARRGCVDDGHASERIVDMMEKIKNT